MTKSKRLGRRSNAKALAHTRPESHALLAQLDRLPADVLLRVVETRGLEECADLLAIATPAQLQGLLDLDVWRPMQAGKDEQLDANRLVGWLEVLLASSAAQARSAVTGMDPDLVVAALTQHVRVFDLAARSEGAADEAAQDLTCELGGYVIESRRTDVWDTVVPLLQYLSDEHSAYFDRVMHGCRSLSNSRPEVDGLNDLASDAEQFMFDVAFEREQRRDSAGYVAPPQARAFLHAARQQTASAPIVAAYFQAMDRTRLTGIEEDLRSAVDVLLDEDGLGQQQRRALPGGLGLAPPLARLQEQMRATQEMDDEIYSRRVEEHAFLANTIAAGCSVQGRAFTPHEASTAAAAVCNLGLENWPSSGPEGPGLQMPDDFLVSHDLISVFQVGWGVLHHDVCLYTAEQLIHVLKSIRTTDRDIRTGLAALRFELARHVRAGEPWRARRALDVIMALDQSTWATLLGLLDECPVLHAAMGALESRTRTVCASAFEFISENRQIAAVRRFLDLVPSRLAD